MNLFESFRPLPHMTESPSAITVSTPAGSPVVSGLPRVRVAPERGCTTSKIRVGALYGGSGHCARQGVESRLGKANGSAQTTSARRRQHRFTPGTWLRLDFV